MKHKIEYMDVDTLESAPRNAKDHDEELIGASFDRFGYAESGLLDERTGLLAAGHGRRDKLRAMRAAGERAPDGIEVAKDGRWLMPIERGWASKDDDDALAAGIAFNSIGERGGWKPQELWDDLSTLQRSDGGLAAVGFGQTDLDLIYAQLHATTKADDGSDDERTMLRPPTNPTTKPGDVWQLGAHRLSCGDCRDLEVVRKLVGDRQVNVAFTSPPYAEQRTYDTDSGFVPIAPSEYVAWFAAVAANVGEVLADDGSWFVNIKPPADGLDTDLYVFDLVIAHVREWGWHFATEFCWERNGVPKGVNKRFKNQFEPIYQFARNGWKIRADNVRHVSENAIVAVGAHQEGRYDGNGQGGAPAGDSDAERGRAVQLSSLAHATKPRPHPHTGPMAGQSGGVQSPHGEPGEATGIGLAYPGNRLPTFAGSHEAVGHAAAFPVGLPAWFVRAYTDPGDVIYDPFAGSGSTILAAHEEGRVGLGVELSPAYCDVIVARFQRLTGVRGVRVGRSRGEDVLKRVLVSR